MNHPIAIVFVFTMLLFTVPHTVSAYFTTGQNVFTVNNITGVFSIDFAFGHEKHAMHIPIHSVRDAVHVDNVLSFAITNSDGEESSGSAFGIVLSDARVIDGMYVIPKGKKMNLRLLVIFTPTQAHEVALDQYRLEVTHLPFSFNGTQQLQLNDTELNHYMTQSLPLGGLVSTTMSSAHTYTQL